MLQIRPARASETDVIATLAKRTFVDTFAAANDPATFRTYVDAAFAPAQIAAELADPAATFLLALDDGVAIGYAKLLAKPADTVPNGVDGEAALELVRFYVDRAHHGTQVAHRLMQNCIDVAMANGYRTMFLGVWEENPRAIAFYRKWGFEVVGDHTFMMGDEAQRDVVMRLVLGD